jgi:hypothetical protein
MCVPQEHDIEKGKLSHRKTKHFLPLFIPSNKSRPVYSIDHGSTPQGSLYGNLHLVRRIYNSTAKIAMRKPANFRKEVRTTEEEPAVADGNGATDIACFASTGVPWILESTHLPNQQSEW